MAINYRLLGKAIHENAVKKQFWVDPDLNRFLALIVDEVGEFVSSLRNCKIANVEQFNDDIMELSTVNSDIEQVRESFKKNIKDSPQDEMADIFIRLLDLSEGVGVHVYDEVGMMNDAVLTKAKKNKDLFMMVNRLSRFIIDLQDKYTGEVNFHLPSAPIKFGRCLHAVEFICEYMGYDLIYHVEQKMMYNEGRPVLHGKKF